MNNKLVKLRFRFCFVITIIITTVITTLLYLIIPFYYYYYDDNTSKPPFFSSVRRDGAKYYFHHFRTDITAKSANCSAIIDGNTVELMKAEKSLEEDDKKLAICAERYIDLATNCSEFVANRGYVESSLTETEETFGIAFSLIMYRDVEQSERLLRAIYRPQNAYCVHVDSKAPNEVFSAVSRIAACFDNVFVAGKRYDVRWGTMTVLEPELLCMEELLNKSSSWKYFINLTGQEFPLKTNYELVEILRAYDGANDIEATIKNANKDRWSNAGKPPHDIVPTKGSVHIVASRGYVDYVLHDQRARDFLNWTRHTEIPDETFFSTMNHNPHLGVPGSYTGVPETGVDKPFLTRFKNWGDWPCRGKRVRSICVFGVGDLPMLASRNELFANKFHLTYHSLALDCAEELHFNRTREQYTSNKRFDSSWYSKLGFVLRKV